MRRDDLVAALRRAGAAAGARRAKIEGALRGLGGAGPASRPGGARERVRAVLLAARRRPDQVVALLLGAGVVAMILHWG